MRTLLPFFTAAFLVLATGTMTYEASAQDSNERLIEQAATLYGFGDLSDQQWQQIERASEQVLEGVRSTRQTINLSQAVAIVYIGLVLQNKLGGEVVPSDDEDPISSGGTCGALSEQVYTFAEFGNNGRNFSLWLKMSLRDDVDDMLEDIKQEASDCQCYEVADVAVEIKIDTSLTQEKFLEHAEAMVDALKSCR